MQTGTTNELKMLRRRRLSDAELARMSCDQGSRQWIDPMLWSEYTGKTARALYESFFDEGLPDILRLTAASWDIFHPKEMGFASAVPIFAAALQTGRQHCASQA